MPISNEILKGVESLATAGRGHALMVHALAMAGGAGLGAYADPDNRGKGALIGAGVGMVAASAPRFVQNINGPAGKAWKAIPGKGILGVGALVAGSAAYGTMTKPAELERAGVAQPSPTGNTDNSEVSYDNYRYSLTDRVATMNAGGDLVLGLHNLRHG
jgi:hypothetical protein